MRQISFLGLIALTWLTGCKQTVTPPPLRSLDKSGALSVVCRDMTTGQGQDINGCPDARATATTGRHTLLMITQFGRGEVAVIDMTTRVVVDEDPAIPGTEFLPVGASPISIASTPGGASTFVATAEPGREAIFVLPTSCAMPPATEEPPRDISQWSACRLPDTPGKMLIVPDATTTSDQNFRQACDQASESTSSASSRDDCPANWDADEQIAPAGRRKVVVTFPKLGGVALLDARKLYELPPGGFDTCPIERWLALSTQVPDSLSQVPPSDLQTTCNISPRYSFGPPQSPFLSQPAGISFKDGELYVADLGVPLVHAVDLKDPCSPRELPPLIPASWQEPTRTVYASNVAVSDLTSSNHRYVYAVDDAYGNIMAFDVSATSQQRTPLVFPGSPYLPFDAPDRIKSNLNNARVLDLTFIKHDVPIVDSNMSSTATQLMCDPNPVSSGPATEYRTASDYTRGAAPSKLRGVFAVTALSDGNIGLIDVEDLDAPCRRPTEINRSSTIDWRGCAGDTTARIVKDSYTDANGARTVSDEVSCNVFEPHRNRSGRFLANNSSVGTNSPSLTVFPALTSPSGSLSGGSSTRANSLPKLLAVPYPVTSSVITGSTYTNLDPSQVNIGSTLYYTQAPQLTDPASGAVLTDATIVPGASLLDIAPTSARNNSLLLPVIEPRAYLPSESYTLTYEGELFPDRQTGIMDPVSLMITDPTVGFCDQGVQDADLAALMADDFILTTDKNSAAQKVAFAPNHTDFVQITQDFSDGDSYWATPPGLACLDPATGITGINGCRSYFGTTDNFKSARELTILEAYQDHLVLGLLPTADSAAINNLHCCFPGTVQYTVRAARQWVLRGPQPLTKLTVDVNAHGRCIRDCDPRKAYLKNRAIEISSSATSCPKGVCTCGSSNCVVGIGPSSDLSNVCVVEDNGQVNPQNVAPGCVFDSLKARFAVYSGTSPSVRDMAFAWQLTGGFVPYQLSLSNRLTGLAVMPQSMTPAPNLNAFFVVDSVSGAVFEFVLDPFTINGDPYL